MAYRASSISTLSGASTTRSLPRPTGAALNDILVLTFYVEDTTLTPALSPGTWTKITGASGEQLADATDFENHTYWSRQGAESGNISITWGGASVFNVASSAAYTGRLVSGDPIEGTPTYNPTGSATTTLTCLSVTTLRDNSDLIGIGSASSGGTYSWATMTERSDGDVQSWADLAQAAAGASGNKTATVTSSFWAGMLIAIQADPGLQATLTPQMFHPGAGIMRQSRHLATYQGAIFSIGPQVYLSDLTAALTFIGSSPKLTSRAQTGGLTFVGTTTKIAAKTLTGGLSFVGAFSKKTLKALTGALTFIGAISKFITRALTGALSFVGSASKITARAYTGAVSFVSAFSKSTRKPFAGSLTLGGAITKFTARQMTAALTFVGALATALSHAGGTLYTISFTAVVSFGGTVAKMAKRALTATLGSSGSSDNPPQIIND